MRDIAILKLGTRGSKLAMAQAFTVQTLLQAQDSECEIEIVPIKTSGDLDRREQLGAFVHELQVALLDRRIDLALHCLKDLPTQPVAGLRLVGHLEREDPSDTLISRKRGLEQLPIGAVVGTGSIRRTSQLAAIRPDLQYKRLIGNVDTRLRKIAEGEYDAIVLAIAGLKRLGLLDNWSASEHSGLIVDPFSFKVMLPAPGQAVLVLEACEHHSAAVELAARLNHTETESAIIAERRFLRSFGGGCSVPVAALATVEGSELELQGLVASPDGRTVIRGTMVGKVGAPEQLGSLLGEDLGSKGAYDVVNAIKGAP